MPESLYRFSYNVHVYDVQLYTRQMNLFSVSGYRPPTIHREVGLSCNTI